MALIVHELAIVRDHPNANGWEGRVFVDQLYAGVSLERTAVMVKPGNYPIKEHPSPHFHRPTIHFIIPDHNYVLAHEGDDPSDSDACFLMGLRDLDGARIGGSIEFIRWLEKTVLTSLRRGELWFGKVYEASAGSTVNLR